MTSCPGERLRRCLIQASGGHDSAADRVAAGRQSRACRDARELFRAYAESIGTDLEYQGFTAELAALPAPYVPPNVSLLTLYRRLGFVEIPPYNDKHLPGTRFYALKLAS